MVLINLFLSFLRTGLFAIGGAYSFLPILEKELIEKYHWLTKEEFLDVLGIVKIFPGAISIKFATYTGYKTSGVAGVIVANVGNLLAPVILVIFASALYAKYKDLPAVKAALKMIELAVFSMIIAVAFQLVNVSEFLNLKSLIVIIVCFIMFLFTKIHPALIIIAAGIFGMLKL